MSIFVNINRYAATLHSYLNSISSWVNNKRERERELTPSRRIFSARVLGGILGGVFLVAVAILLAACPASTNTSSVTLYDYVCANGTPADGGATEENSTRCTRCNTGFKLTQAKTCVMRPYVCANGTPSGEDATADNITKCQSCANGYVLTAAETCNHAYVCNNGIPSQDTDAAAANITKCQSCANGYVLTAAETCNHAYVCSHGTPVTDTDASGDNVTQCASCTSGYLLTTNNSCTNDLDNDGVLNATDVDDDNDGLIEVPDLTALHNMRYNLVGTSYKISSADTGNTTGAPTSATANCSSATGGVYLCGYELTQDLTFDQDGDGKTFDANNSGGYTLDSGDNNAVYFPVANDGSGGWLPIGDNTNAFTAIFDGNGYTISHLAVSRDQRVIGMFGTIGTTSAGAIIRNIGLVNGLADYSGSSGGLVNNNIGGLVGHQKYGTIIAVYADVTADGGTGNVDYVGGLVGIQNTGIIIASYATGTVHGGAGQFDYVGGLVGSQGNATIIASYATGSVNGGVGNNDKTGGLVGIQNTGSMIIASYASGSVNGGAGSNTNDYVGNLTGEASANSITASYGFGTIINADITGINFTLPNGVTSPNDLTAANAGAAWNRASDKTLGAWDFGTSSQPPALKYADYDGAGTDYSCDMFPAGKCGTLIPGQGR